VFFVLGILLQAGCYTERTITIRQGGQAMAGLTRARSTEMSSNNGKQSAVDFVERVRVNQRKLSSGLKAHYDFIVCGSGSSGSVVARRLAENPDVSALRLEAGGGDDVPSVMDADKWPLKLGSGRSWNFQAPPDPRLNRRSTPLNLGKVLGGG